MIVRDQNAWNAKQNVFILMKKGRKYAELLFSRGFERRKCLGICCLLFAPLFCC